MKAAHLEDRGVNQVEITELLEPIVSVICATRHPTATRDMVFQRIVSGMEEINGLAQASVHAFPKHGKPPATP